MKTITRDGLWADVCTLPSGAFVHVVGERGAVAAYQGTDRRDPMWRQVVATDFLRFLRCAAAADGSIRAIGQGGDGRAWFVGPGIAELLPVTYGINCVALRHDGQGWIAYIVVRPDAYQIVRLDGDVREVAMPVTSQGIRDVAPDGTVIFADSTGTFDGYTFGEYQRRDGVVAGQHGHAVGVLLEARHHFFTARSGQVNFGVRVATSGDRIALCALTEAGAWFSEFEPPFPPAEPADSPAGVITPQPPPGQNAVPPAVTIREYAPTSGEAPLAVEAVAAVTAGIVNTFTWRWRHAGESIWRTDGLSGAQTTHRFRFDSPGIYEISLRGDGPGGSAETGQRRPVTVNPKPVVGPTLPPRARVVTLRTVSGHYLCADLGAGARLVADRLQAGPWETFTVESAGPDAIRLKAANGRYVAAEDGGGRELVANRDAAGIWEQFRVVTTDNGGVALQTSNGQFVRVESGTGAVRADGASAGAAEIFTSSIPLILKHTPGRIAGRLRVDGRFFVNDAGTFRPVFTSALSVLRRPDAEVRAVLDRAARTGFNGIRTFAGALTWAGQTASAARERLPFLLTEAGARGLYVEVTAITDSREGYDTDGHFLAVARACDRVDNAIVEIANEPYHGTQIDRVHSADYLLTLGRQTQVPFALGAAADDESTEMSGGAFVTVHLDRGRDKWNQVRRVRELAALAETTRKPVMNNEPIGAAEASQPGRRESDPAFFFCLGALNRVFEVGGVFHSEAGLNAALPGPVQQDCAEAFVAGSRVIPVEDRLAFKNAGWTDSPIARARFDQTIVRAYTGVSGARAWTILVGLTGDPGLEFQHGWRAVNRLAERPGVAVLELQRTS